MSENNRVYKSAAPYNFIGLDKFILERCSEENEIMNHDRYCDDLNTGCIKYEIEVLTPLHISSGEENSDKVNLLFKNPQEKYVIPGNTIRGMTRFNASVFSFASVINKSTNKKDIANNRFYYRTFASNDKGMREWYNKKVGFMARTSSGFTYTVLENVEAGYIRKHGNGYTITPAVKLGNKSYTSIHEFELRNKGIRGINYLYQDGLKKEDYKDKNLLLEKKNRNYRPYIKEIRYNTDGNRPIIDINGKYKGCLANSNYIDGKVHHFLIFEEDKNSEVIYVTKEQAELYIDDMKYTHKQNANSKKAKKAFEYYELPNREVKPVFFVKENNNLFFGFTPYLRLPADGDIYDGIPETHRNYKGRDFVDSIFGWLDFRTKVSFLDALCEDPEPFNDIYQMVLGEPKPSWYKGYIKQEKENALESYCSEKYKIRGRKFYWMKDSADTDPMLSSLPGSGKEDRISTKMYCIKEKTKFSGEVRFENLSDEELGLLLYSLKQGDTEGYFSLGMGKPYGLGKCKIKVNQLIIDNLTERYMSFRNNSGKEKTGEIDKYISAFKKYVIDHYKIKVNDVNEIKSYKEYSLSKHIMKNIETRYMRIDEFANRSELPTLEEVINGIRVSDKMKIDEKPVNKHQNKNKHRNYQNKKPYDNLNTNAFAILKDLKFEENKD